MLFDDDRMLLGPYATTPPRIADEVTGALAGVPGVRAVALIGSLAAGTHDGFSDIDMLVACDGAPAAVAAAVVAIEAAKPVRYFRPFAGVAQPSGRYWFDGESPFHHLDATFCDERDYERIRRDGTKDGLTIDVVETWRTAATGMRGREHAGARRCVALDDDEWERHGRFVYFLAHARSYLRGLCDRAAFDAAWGEFLDATRGVRFDARTPAGRLGEMIQDCWQVRGAIDRAERGG